MEIDRDLAERLKFLIKRHHMQYIHLFNDTLKPKHHLMLHYFTVILKSGPPRNYWCFRFEAMHKEFKAYARAITSRKNISVSLAKKYQLKFAYSLQQPKSDTCFFVQENHIIQSTHMDLISKLCEQINIYTPYLSYKQCTFRRKIFKTGFFVCQYVDIDIENAAIYEVKEIIKFIGHDTPYVICELVKIKAYLKHFASFEITTDTNLEPTFKILSIALLAGPPITLHKTARGLKMIRPKQY